MNIKIWFAAMVAAMVVLCTQSVSMAEVITCTEVQDGSNLVYIAGNDDFYPVEYYNKETKNYEGAIPRMLERISERTGIDFAYLRTGQSQEELARSKQVDIVSAYIIGDNKDYIASEVVAFTCSSYRQTMNIGWGFTSIADTELVNIMNKSSDMISEQEINGYLVMSSNGGRKSDKWFIPFTVLYSVVVLVLIAYIIFKIKTTNRRLRRDKITDAQTGIGNFLYFERCFDNYITQSTRDMYYIAYIIIDSNYLQAYYGEAMFKDAVKYTAGVLDLYIIDDDFAARITENGFAFAYKCKDKDESEQKISELMEKLNLYIEDDSFDKQPYYYMAAYHLNNNDNSCGSLLFNLRKNCTAIMGSKEQYVLCNTYMMNSVSEEKKLIENILNGLKNNEFKLYLQFLVDNRTKNIVSAEALSRWESPDMGLLYPGRYIDAMERSGHITILDYYMFEMCCRQLHKWRDTEFDNITISCNFTRITLSEPDLIEKITEISEKYVFDRRKLIIEITEDTIERNFERATDNIRKCKALGYRIALDDMGTGYTSLSNLCEYPIDIVKIDRDILIMTNTQNGKRLFMGIIALSHSLGLKVVCEGVETEKQKALVDTTECDYVQGWYYSRVFPCREGEEFAKKYI